MAATPAVFALTVDLSSGVSAPVLDGRVETHETANATKVALNLVGGIDRPRNATSAWFALTTDSLYIAFVCEDGDPKGIVCSAKDNGAVFLDESVQVFFTPEREGTGTNYFHFAVSPTGARYSCDLKSDRPLEGWRSAASCTAKGWEGEMIIPLQTVRASKSARYWRANLARERPARGAEARETTAWVNPGTSLHNYRRFGFLQLQTAKAADVPAAETTATAQAEKEQASAARTAPGK